MGRSPSFDESGLKKGPWTPEEDQKLIEYIQKHGHGSWRTLPKLAGLNRCGKSCRLRWINYLRPDVKRGNFSLEEEQTILNLHSILGNKWSAIASHLPGRTDNEIKNYWNTNLKKKLIQMGFDPMTHRPLNDMFATLPHLLAILDHQSLEQYALRLQVQAGAMASLEYLQYLLQPTMPCSLLQQQQQPSPSSSSINDTEAMNLFNSLAMQENEVLTNSPNPLPDNIIQQPSLDTLLPFTHMPNLQVPCSFYTSVNKEEIVHQALPEFCVFSQEGNSPYSPWQLPSSSTPSPNTPHPPLPATIETTLMNYGEATTHSVWPDELSFQLEDFHDIA